MSFFRPVLLLLLALLLFGCNGEPEIVVTPPIAPANTPEPAGEAVATLAPAESPTSVAIVIDSTEPTAAAEGGEVVTATEAPADPPTEEPAVVMPAFPPAANLIGAIQLVPVASGLWNMTNMAHAGDERIFVTGQGGQVWIIENGSVLGEPFLDVSSLTDLTDATERGLLDIAFHPDYSENGYFYINYTDLNGHTVVSRWQVSDDPNRADPDSESIVLQVQQPYSNHNGGQIEFGPDGYLYIGLGDGGNQGDTEGNGQNPQTLLGAILRIDVDSASPYAIPADNPFINDDNVRNEIWAYGVRNPWGLQFDSLTGDLYFADVGQDLWEEVNWQPAGVGGQNYGWNILEATHCYGAENCDETGLTLPIHEYNHDIGACSITGGAVYRGDEYPQMQGNYFFGDLCLGSIWAMVSNGDGSWSVRAVQPQWVSSVVFAADAAGNLYVGDRGTDTLFRIEPAG